ncbi:hypothetical protein [Barrientosiimonas endolithica]|uniref:4Fe-4S ferredoxin-type domain-containing protein n=1 Tax=Barrientosiimonas endolithica TaxID=1535208 RepID=A0ABN6YQS0_9MICO|nr:hypothetical protein [Barrientosiimonas endolithica]BDZ59742.1 hypothetical protein GCM10025872_33990 [Barrientosiimonas endolithica]
MRDIRRGWWRATETVKHRVRPLRDRVVAAAPATSRFLVRRPAMQSLHKQRMFWTDPERPIKPLPFTEASVEAILRQASALGPDDRVLEVGSGLGATLAALVDHGVTNVTGVEINPLRCNGCASCTRSWPTSRCSSARPKSCSPSCPTTASRW